MSVRATYEHARRSAASVRLSSSSHTAAKQPQNTAYQGSNTAGSAKTTDVTTYDSADSSSSTIDACAMNWDRGILGVVVVRADIWLRIVCYK